MPDPPCARARRSARRALLIAMVAVIEAAAMVAAASATEAVDPAPVVATSVGRPWRPAPKRSAEIRFGDSITIVGPGRGVMTPVDSIEHPLIGECSGIACLDGAWFAHNDSGDAATLYRSVSLDFARAEILPLPWARAIDWEDITVLEGDLVVGDVGDNGHRRPYVTLYRARYVPRPPGSTRSSGWLEPVAVYPFRYPDGAHDCEALAVVDGQLIAITKERGEGVTGVYRFESLIDQGLLAPETVNVPTLVGTLDLLPGERATAADYDPRSRMLVVLTYSRLLGWPADRLEGPPALATEISLRQCEALCFREDQLIIANEQRSVYAIDDFVRRRFLSLRPLTEGEGRP